MKERVRFSIVVPFFNSSQFLDRLFLTLKDYCNKDCEIIVVDDCSDQIHYNLLCEYASNLAASNLVIIRNVVNKGAAYSRQVGVEAASGDFIAFLDSDDGWGKDRLFLLYDTMISHKIDILGGRVQQVDIDDFISLRENRFLFNDIKKVSFFNFLFKNYYATSSVFVKRSIFLKHNFNTNMRYSEDYECWRRIVLNSNSYFISFSNVYCFKHVYLPGNVKSLSSSLGKMLKSEIKGLYLVLFNNNIPFFFKLIVPLGIIFSFFKAVLRFIRVKFN